MTDAGYTKVCTALGVALVIFILKKHVRVDLNIAVRTVQVYVQAQRLKKNAYNALMLIKNDLS